MQECGMHPLYRLPHAKNILVMLAIALSPSGANAGRAQDLKQCLADFDGIEWKLPYQPPIKVHRCVSSSVSYDGGDKTPQRTANLELISSLTLGADSNLPSDETYAALQVATFAHFDALFVRRGYRRTELENADARTKYDPQTLAALKRPFTAQHAAHNALTTPLPYTRLARYVRSEGDHQATLTYQTDARNTWLIKLEWHRAEPTAVGGPK